MNADKKRAMKAGLSKRMRDYAIRRQCPACERKSALKLVRFDRWSSALICRWPGCGYERFLDRMEVEL